MNAFILIYLTVVISLIFITLFIFPDKKLPTHFRIRACSLFVLSASPFMIHPLLLLVFCQQTIRSPGSIHKDKDISAIYSCTNKQITIKLNKQIEDENIANQKSLDAQMAYLKSGEILLQDPLTILISFFCASLGANMYMHGYAKQQYYPWVRSPLAKECFNSIISLCNRINRFLTKEMRK